MHVGRKGFSPVAARVSTLLVARRWRRLGAPHRRFAHLVSMAIQVGPRLGGREGRLGGPDLPSRLPRVPPRRRRGSPLSPTLGRGLRRGRRVVVTWWASHTLD